jgi:hypothetical protein
VSVTLLADLARFGQFPPSVAAQVFAQLASTYRLLTEVSSNPHLTKQAWFVLYPRKPLPPVTVALNLVDRDLDEDRMAHVLTVESRARVLDRMRSRNLLRHSVVSRLERPSLPKALAEAMLGVAYLDRRRFDAAFALAGPLAQAEALLYAASEPTEQERHWVRTSLVGLDGLKSRRAKHLVMAGLLDRNRDLLCDVIGDLQDLSPVAQLPSLDEDVQLALVDRMAALPSEVSVWPARILAAAPTTRYSALERLAEKAGPHRWSEIPERVSRRLLRGPASVWDMSYAPQEQLDRLIERAAPSGAHPVGRPLEAVRLLCHPQLRVEQANALLSGVANTRLIDRVFGAGIAVWLDRIRLADRHRADQLGSHLSCPLLSRPPVQLYGGSFISDEADRRLLDTKVTAVWGPAQAGALSRLASDRLGDDPDRWDVLLALSGEFDGTVSDLLEVAALL